MMVKEEFLSDEKGHLVKDLIKQHRKELVDNYVSKITLHGYVRFHEASGIRKIFWGLILCCMVAFIIRMTYLAFGNNHNQIIDVHHENRNNLTFPTITLCNIKPVYSEETLQHFPLNLTEVEFRKFYRQVFVNGRWPLNKTLFDRVYGALKKGGYVSYKDVLKKFEVHENSHEVEAIFGEWSCTFNSKPCDLETQVKTVTRYSYESLCKQFNFYEKGKTGLIQTETGIRSGLNLYWDISGYEHDDESPFQTWGLRGMIMQIHPYGTPHHLTHDKDHVFLEPGTLTYIGVEQKDTHYLHAPYEPHCSEPEFKVIKDYPYSRSMCEVDCLMQLYLSECGCVADEFHEYLKKGIRICNITEMYCTFKISDNECRSCPVECHFTEFQIKTKSRLDVGDSFLVSAMKLLKSKKARVHERGPHFEEAARAKLGGENIVAIRVGLTSLDVEVVKHKDSVPWFDRLSLLGGTMGLLLGFSLLTGIEFLFFLFDYLYSATPMFARKFYKNMKNNY